MMQRVKVILFSRRRMLRTMMTPLDKHLEQINALTNQPYPNRISAARYDQLSLLLNESGDTR